MHGARTRRCDAGPRSISGATCLAAAAALLVACAHVDLGFWRKERAARPPVAADARDVYRVKSGDTLARVAAWYGTSAGELAALNGMDLDDRLAPGDALRVPPRRLRTHQVRPGDTLSALSLWYGVTVEDLAHLNDVSDPRRLEVGRALRLPATAKRSTPAPPPRRVARAAPPRPTPDRVDGETAPPGPPADTAAVAAPPPAAGAAAADAALARAEAAFDAADFEAALREAAAARAALPAPADAADRRRVARAHLLTGMAQVALERSEEARASFRQALALDPELELDPAAVSPKILTAFRDARGD